MPKQKRWALKQSLERALEHLVRATELIGSVSEEVHEAHPESPAPLHDAGVVLVLIFGEVDRYRDSI